MRKAPPTKEPVDRSFEACLSRLCDAIARYELLLYRPTDKQKDVQRIMGPQFVPYTHLVLKRYYRALDIIAGTGEYNG